MMTIPSPLVMLGIRRSAEMAAIFMIGDGMLGALQPKRHIDLWRSDVAAVDIMVRPFDEHPARRRVYGILQIGAGLLLAASLRCAKPAGADPDRASST